MATDNFDFNLDFDLTPPTVIEPVREAPILTDSETSIANSKAIFNPSEHPLKEMDWHERMQHELRMSKRKLITSYKVGKIKIVYDGVDYKAELTTTMHGDGFAYWQQLYEKEIALARAMCYAQHVVTYGNYGQIIPPKASEYFTMKECEMIKLREQQAMKEVSIDIDAIQVPKQISKEEAKYKTTL